MRARVTLGLLTLALAGCQPPPEAGVVLNSSGEEIELSYRFNRIPNPPYSPICSRQPAIPLISEKRFKKPRNIPTSLEGWSQSTSHQGDDSGCGMQNIRLQPGQAALVAINAGCDDFQLSIARNGADTSQYVPPFARLSAAAGHGFFTLEDWDVTSRFKRTKSRLCVLEITQADLRNQG